MIEREAAQRLIENVLLVMIPPEILNDWLIEKCENYARYMVANIEADVVLAQERMTESTTVHGG